MSGDDDGVTGESDMGDHELAPLPDNHPGDRGHGGLEHHGGYSDHDREMSYDREQKYMSKYGCMEGGLSIGLINVINNTFYRVTKKFFP